MRGDKLGFNLVLIWASEASPKILALATPNFCVSFITYEVTKLHNEVGFGGKILLKE